MKIINKIFLFISILCVLSLGFTTTVYASTPERIHLPDDIIVGNYTLESGDSTEGDVVTFGGNIVIEENSTIFGSLASIGGTVDFNGELTGDFVCIGGECNIGDAANIGGSLVVVGSSLDLSSEAVIIGEHIFVGNDSIDIPPIEFTTGEMPEVPNVPPAPENYYNQDFGIDNNPGLNFLQDLFSKAFMILAVSALALLVGLLFPKHLKKTSATIVNEPVKSAVLGLLTITAGPIALAVIALTIILIPVSLIGFFTLFVLVFYGWVAVGYILGERIAKGMNAQWDIIITTGIGTLALSTMAALIAMIPCVGFLIYPIVFFIGLGGVFISQFGNREVKPGPVTATPVSLPDKIVEAEVNETTSDDLVESDNDDPSSEAQAEEDTKA
jgi:hypothetical protein